MLSLIMLYKITGTNHSTGARMSLEFEAESKAAAERKARGAGMDVQHVQDITDGDMSGPRMAHTHRGENSGGGGAIAGLIKLIVIFAVLGVIAYFAWPKIRMMLHHH